MARRKILVMEDNPINRETPCAILSLEYQMLQAENGRDALFCFENKKERLALILADITMPVMDGYTFAVWPSTYFSAARFPFL